MIRMDKFCVIVLCHCRPNDTTTPNTLRQSGYTGDIILCEQKYGLYIGFDGLKEKHLCITTNSSVPDMFRDDTFNKDIQVKNFTVVSESGIEMLDEASYLIKHESQYYYKWILEWDAYNLKFPEKAVENLHKIITFDYRMYNKGKYWFM